MFTTTLKDTVEKIFRVFEIRALKSGWFGAPISCDLGHFGVWLKCLTALVFHILDDFKVPWTGRSQGGESLFLGIILGGARTLPNEPRRIQDHEMAKTS